MCACARNTQKRIEQTNGRRKRITVSAQTFVLLRCEKKAVSTYETAKCARLSLPHRAECHGYCWSSDFVWRMMNKHRWWYEKGTDNAINVRIFLNYSESVLSAPCSHQRTRFAHSQLLEGRAQTARALQVMAIVSQWLSFGFFCFKECKRVMIVYLSVRSSACLSFIRSLVLCVLCIDFAFLSMFSFSFNRCQRNSFILPGACKNYLMHFQFYYWFLGSLSVSLSFFLHLSRKTSTKRTKDNGWVRAWKRLNTARKHQMQKSNFSTVVETMSIWFILAICYV